MVAGLASSLTWASPASAQLNVRITAWPDRTNPQLTNLNTPQTAVTLDECNNVTIDLQYQSVPTGNSTLFYFYGTNCETQPPTRNTDQSSCTLLPHMHNITTTTFTDSVMLSDLLDCTATEGTRTIYAMVMNNETDNVMATQYLQFSMRYDFVPPTAPDSLVASAGENAVTLMWTASSETLNPYEVYVDPAGCPDGSTPSGALIDNDPPPESLLVASDAPGNTGTASVSIPSSVGVGSYFAVGLRAVDAAGNAGPISVTCAQRVDVTSWWEAYCQSPDADADACMSGGCAVQPRSSRAPTPTLWLSAIAMIALLVVRRRTR
ncbi:MAG: hypothetical protein AB7S26_06310 [Sandaracinaceae bacterium]